MIGAINLWDLTHVTLAVDLLTAFLVGIGMTTFVTATQDWRRRLLAESGTPLPLKP